MASTRKRYAVTIRRRRRYCRWRPRRRWGRRRSRSVVSRVPRTSVTLGRGFPKRVTMTHKYCDSQILNPVGVSLARLIYRANGMFDPQVALGGHQPLYFDQMSALYNHYVVIGSRCKFTVTRQPGTDPLVLELVGFLNDDTNLTPTTVGGVAEQTGAKLRVLGTDNVDGSGQKNSVITINFSARKQYGRGNLNNARIQGTSGADPTEQSFFELVAGNPTWTPGEQTVHVMVEIEYIAVWTEPKDVAQS